jgi:hypothetical protein
MRLGNDSKQSLFLRGPARPRAWLSGLMQVLRVEDDPHGGCGFSLGVEALTFCTEAKD